VDVDGDGKDDIVASGSGSEAYFVMQNTSSGAAGNITFASALQIGAGGTNPVVGASVDVNGDGVPDVAGIVDDGFSTMTTIRPDPRDAWLRVLTNGNLAVLGQNGAPNVANAAGDALGLSGDATTPGAGVIDLFRKRVVTHFSQRRYATMNAD